VYRYATNRVMTTPPNYMLVAKQALNKSRVGTHPLSARRRCDVTMLLHTHITPTRASFDVCFRILCFLFICFDEHLLLHSGVFYVFPALLFVMI